MMWIRSVMCRSHVLLFVVVWCLLDVGFNIVLVDGDSSVYIVSPQSVRESDPLLNVPSIPNKPAMFGVARYGSSVSGALWYPKDELNRLACGIRGINMDRENDDYPLGVGGVIVMLDRSPKVGNSSIKCSFVTKVFAASSLPGVVAVIIRNRPNENPVFMADDGTGLDLRTPSVLIDNEVGGLLSAAMRVSSENQTSFVPITVQIGWQIPTANGTVTWQFWTSAYDAKSYELKTRFGRADAVLHNSTRFEPKYNFYSGDDVMSKRCAADPIEQECQTGCIKKGRYCVDDPDGIVDNWLDGNIALRENVWQMCVWKQIEAQARSDPNTQQHLTRNKWWTYVSLSENICDTEEELVNPATNEPVYTCRHGILNQIGFGSSFGVIRSCYEDCHVDDYMNTSDCELLETMATERLERGVFWTPTLMINDEPILGYLSCNTPLEPRSCQVLAEICMGYSSSTRPSICTASPTGCDFSVPRDCAGVCNGTASFDACGSCLAADDPLRNKSCTDCNGVLNGGATYDKCGVCSLPDSSGRNSTCTDCAGTINGKAKVDCAGECEGKAIYDDCGACIRWADRAKAWNKTCDGSSSPSTTTNMSESSTNWGAVIVITLAVAGIVGVAIYLYMKRQQNRMREDIDGILKQYLPLQDGTGGTGHIRPTQRLDGNETL